MCLPDLTTRLESATLLTTGESLAFDQQDAIITLHNLPETSPTPLFPVIKLSFAGRPTTTQWGRERLWDGDPARVADWARSRGEGPNVDGGW